jgi:hypothetical protein
VEICGAGVPSIVMTFDDTCAVHNYLLLKIDFSIMLIYFEYISMFFMSFSSPYVSLVLMVPSPHRALIYRVHQLGIARFSGITGLLPKAATVGETGSVG